MVVRYSISDMLRQCAMGVRLYLHFSVFVNTITSCFYIYDEGNMMNSVLYSGSAYYRTQYIVINTQ